uniref:Uncharacterized protein n=1 Tax=Lepeophtheirus salmonis TaxID=72036 RepID=A0A0K2V486_LEPSM
MVQLATPSRRQISSKSLNSVFSEISYESNTDLDTTDYFKWYILENRVFATPCWSLKVWKSKSMTAWKIQGISKLI